MDKEDDIYICVTFLDVSLSLSLSLSLYIYIYIYIYIMEYYLAIKKNEIMPFAAT